MSEENTEKRLKDLEKRFENLNDYLSKNGEIVIDLVMRAAALEKILIKNNLFSEEEIQEEVKKTYANLADKAREAMGVQDGSQAG